MVLVQSHALVSDATLGGLKLALGFWCAIVDELKLGVLIRTCLVDNGAANGGRLFL
tara:strand:- start:1283 stop:1450 length:168 start_codon:yes stop_codon:yes gene_type:complete